ncbi:MAG: TIGR04150 pseudo-rSAM protein [Tannerella sp.]|jgi:pseudo-rSAM protein|nr:TIGR04150 pseudo-rSAM protein [Tannerella sp.]
MQTPIDYWFIIEPYMYVGLTKKNALLYNTLDGVTLESDKEDVIKLLKEILQKDNCGVVLLTDERYKQKDINGFIHELREKYMGDVIDVTLSKGKPVQLLPYYNYPNNQELYKKHNFTPRKNILEDLSEINIHVNAITNIKKLIPFLQSIPEGKTFNIIGNIGEVTNYSEILSYFDQHPSPKNMLCSYKDVIALQPTFMNNFSCRISVCFPVDMQHWSDLRQLLLSQTSPVEYIFDVSSDGDCLQAEYLIKQFQIEKYRLNPVYTGDNIRFFEENVFLTKEDILSISMTIKDFFTRQAINLYDFGKINIMPNGDAYANLNYPVLGNIYVDNIYEIIQKEINEGKSWFRIRDQAPCTDCVCQWLCPPPSNYEIALKRPNLCHKKVIDSMGL